MPNHKYIAEGPKNFGLNFKISRFQFYKALYIGRNVSWSKYFLHSEAAGRGDIGFFGANLP